MEIEVAMAVAVADDEVLESVDSLRLLFEVPGIISPLPFKDSLVDKSAGSQIVVAGVGVSKLTCAGSGCVL